MKNILSIIFVILIVVSIVFFSGINKPERETSVNTDEVGQLDAAGDIKDALHPLTIESLRQGEYPGSEITIEQTLKPGSNYQRYLASYKSEGLKIYGLLTVPDSSVGKSPVIVFNHGYISPSVYQTTERYLAYVDGFASSGYIVFKPDYRGHGNSEGEAEGAYGSNAYTIDVLNAVASIKKFKDADAEKIGMWGHSMGGHITLKNMVVNKDIKAGVIWAGVVGDYTDLINNWRRGSATPIPSPSGARRWRQVLIEKYGTPQDNPEFWKSISANSYLSEISGPLQLHHGTGDASVPVVFSQKLADQLKASGKEVELYTYPGDDHNLTSNFNTAMKRSIDFFDKYLKGGEKN